MSPGKSCRRLLWKAFRKLPAFEVSVRTPRGVFGVSSRDAGVGRILFIHREYEWAVIDKALRIAVSAGKLAPRSRGWLLDIGANVGTVCIPLLREGRFAHALAVEPEAGNYRQLVRNLERNDVAHAARPVNCALSSSTGSATLELSRNSGDHRVRTEATPAVAEQYHEDRRPLASVPVYRLDDLLEHAAVPASDVALIWMDVQGHESHVLEGAHKTLKAAMPVVAEFWPYGLARTGVSPDRFTRLMQDHFDIFYDLAEDTPAPRPTADIRLLYDKHEHFKSFTDLLLLRR
jgi:FkbM family methyltransferase